MSNDIEKDYHKSLRKMTYDDIVNLILFSVSIVLSLWSMTLIFVYGFSAILMALLSLVSAPLLMVLIRIIPSGFPIRKKYVREYAIEASDFVTPIELSENEYFFYIKGGSNSSIKFKINTNTTKKKLASVIKNAHDNFMESTSNGNIYPESIPLSRESSSRIKSADLNYECVVLTLSDGKTINIKHCHDTDNTSDKLMYGLYEYWIKTYVSDYPSTYKYTPKGKLKDYKKSFKELNNGGELGMNISQSSSNQKVLTEFDEFDRKMNEALGIKTEDKSKESSHEKKKKKERNVKEYGMSVDEFTKNHVFGEIDFREKRIENSEVTVKVSETTRKDNYSYTVYFLERGTHKTLATSYFNTSSITENEMNAIVTKTHNLFIRLSNNFSYIPKVIPGSEGKLSKFSSLEKSSTRVVFCQNGYYNFVKAFTVNDKITNPKKSVIIGFYEKWMDEMIENEIHAYKEKKAGTSYNEILEDVLSPEDDDDLFLFPEDDEYEIEMGRYKISPSDLEVLKYALNGDYDGMESFPISEGIRKRYKAPKND